MYTGTPCIGGFYINYNNPDYILCHFCTISLRIFISVRLLSFPYSELKYTLIPIVLGVFASVTIMQIIFYPITALLSAGPQTASRQ